MARKPSAAALAPAVRPDLSLTPEEVDLSSAAVDTFTVALGGREALLETLAIADGTPEVHKILNLLIDPRYADWSLRRICALSGLTIADLFVAYRKALIVRAHLQATRLVADNLVAVVDDVMKRAQPYEIPCEDCRGIGQVTPEPTKAQPNPSPGLCGTCRGHGRLIQHPDLDRQKVALELGQMLQQRGILMQQNNLTLPPGGASTLPGSLEQLQQAVHATLYAHPTRAEEDGVVIETVTAPIDGEVAEADAERRAAT